LKWRVKETSKKTSKAGEVRKGEILAERNSMKRATRKESATFLCKKYKGE